jgi:Glycosyl hydrolase family 47
MLPPPVQVFEANIRLLGGLLSAHLLMEDANFPGLSPDWYLGKSLFNLLTSVPVPVPIDTGLKYELRLLIQTKNLVRFVSSSNRQIGLI